MGALLGRKTIPKYYTNDLEIIDVIEEVAEDLFTGSVVSDYAPNDSLEEVRWLEKYVNFKRAHKE